MNHYSALLQRILEKQHQLFGTSSNNTTNNLTEPAGAPAAATAATATDTQLALLRLQLLVAAMQPEGGVGLQTNFTDPNSVSHSLNPNLELNHHHHRQAHLTPLSMSNGLVNRDYSTTLITPILRHPTSSAKGYEASVHREMRKVDSGASSTLRKQITHRQDSGMGTMKTLSDPSTTSSTTKKNKQLTKKRDRSEYLTSNDKNDDDECSEQQLSKHSKASSSGSSSPSPKKKDSKWLTTLEELKEYKRQNGDCIVPRGYAVNPRLASWVAEQRKQYKLLQDGRQSSITPERVAQLNQLNFAWNAQEAAWTRHISDLQQFRNENGHSNVPLSDQKFPKLGLWVKEQRRHYTLMKQGKASHMTPERAAELETIGFCWDTHEAAWSERFRELTEYKAKFGSCIVPTNYADNPKLATWVHHQRRQYKKYKNGKPCHITPERIQALDQLGFVWSPREKSGVLGQDSSSSDSESDYYSSDDCRPRKRQRA